MFIISHSPYVFSRGYSFFLSDTSIPVGYIVPTWISGMPLAATYGPEDAGSCIFLPLKENMYASIFKTLRGIDMGVLLNLNKIAQFSITFTQDNVTKKRVLSSNVIKPSFEFEQLSIKQVELSAIVYETKKINAQETTKETKQFLCFSQIHNVDNHSEKLRANVTETMVNTCFPIGESSNIMKNVYAYFPTQMESNLPFVIHADFLVQPSRENLYKENEWNALLLKYVASTASVAYVYLTEHFLEYMHTWIPCLNTTFFGSIAKEITIYLIQNKIKCIYLSGTIQQCEPSTYIYIGTKELYDLLDQTTYNKLHFNLLHKSIALSQHCEKIAQFLQQWNQSKCSTEVLFIQNYFASSWLKEINTNISFLKLAYKFAFQTLSQTQVQSLPFPVHNKDTFDRAQLLYSVCEFVTDESIYNEFSFVNQKLLEDKKLKENIKQACKMFYQNTYIQYKCKNIATVTEAIELCSRLCTNKLEPSTQIAIPFATSTDTVTIGDQRIVLLPCTIGKWAQFFDEEDIPNCHILHENYPQDETFVKFYVNHFGAKDMPQVPWPTSLSDRFFENMTEEKAALIMKWLEYCLSKNSSGQATHIREKLQANPWIPTTMNDFALPQNILPNMSKMFSTSLLENLPISTVQFDANVASFLQIEQNMVSAAANFLNACTNAIDFERQLFIEFLAHVQSNPIAISVSIKMIPVLDGDQWIMANANQCIWFCDIDIPSVYILEKLYPEYQNVLKQLGISEQLSLATFQSLWANISDPQRCKALWCYGIEKFGKKIAELCNHLALSTKLEKKSQLFIANNAEIESHLQNVDFVYIPTDFTYNSYMVFFAAFGFEPITSHVGIVNVHDCALDMGYVTDVFKAIVIFWLRKSNLAQYCNANVFANMHVVYANEISFSFEQVQTNLSTSIWCTKHNKLYILPHHNLSNTVATAIASGLTFVPAVQQQLVIEFEKLLAMTDAEKLKCYSSTKQKIENIKQEFALVKSTAIVKPKNQLTNMFTTGTIIVNCNTKYCFSNLLANVEHGNVTVTTNGYELPMHYVVVISCPGLLKLCEWKQSYIINLSMYHDHTVEQLIFFLYGQKFAVPAESDIIELLQLALKVECYSFVKYLADSAVTNHINTIAQKYTEYASHSAMIYYLQCLFSDSTEKTMQNPTIWPLQKIFAKSAPSSSTFACNNLTQDQAIHYYMEQIDIHIESKSVKLADGSLDIDSQVLTMFGFGNIDFSGIKSAVFAKLVKIMYMGSGRLFVNEWNALCACQTVQKSFTSWQEFNFVCISHVVNTCTEYFSSKLAI